VRDLLAALGKVLEDRLVVARPRFDRALDRPLLVERRDGQVRDNVIRDERGPRPVGRRGGVGAGFEGDVRSGGRDDLLSSKARASGGAKAARRMAEDSR